MSNICKRLAFFGLFVLLNHSVNAQGMFNGYGSYGASRAAYLNWLAYQKAKREGSNLKKWWKGEETIGVAFSGPLNYTERSKYTAIPNVSQESYDTSLIGTAKPQLSFSLNNNSNHLIKRLGSGAIVSISVGANVNIMRWKFDSWNGNSQKSSETSLIYVQLGIPVTLDYKWGCDVDFDPEQKSCFAIGVGGMPMVGASLSGFESASTNFRVAPYAYASAGFYFHGCWKIRLSYIPGKYTVFKDATANYGGTINTLSIQGNNIFTIGICHMDHSNDWGKGSAWRGNDGGGHHGFGGRRRHVSESSRMF